MIRWGHQALWKGGRQGREFGSLELAGPAMGVEKGTPLGLSLDL